MNGWRNIGVVLGLMGIMTLCGAQPPVVTNVQLLQQNLVQPLIQVLDSLGATAPGVSVHVEGSEELNRWFEQKLKENVLSKHWNLVKTDSSGKNDDFFVLQVEKVAATILYRSKDKNWLLRTTRYQREVEGLVRYQFTRKQRILQADEIHFRVQDEISRKDLKRVENDLFPFARGEHLPSPWIDWVLEPVIITAATLTVVYLFYTLRSRAR